MTERARMRVLCGSLAAIVLLLSWGILGSTATGSCQGGWVGYTPPTGKVVALGRCLDGRTDPALPPGEEAEFRKLLEKIDRDAERDRRRVPGDVVTQDERAPMADEDFDDTLWFSLSSRIESADDLAGFTPGVRMYFAIRMVEDEVANGGFSQVFENGVDEWLPAARAGYVLLGDDASAQLLDRVMAASGDAHALDALDESLDAPPWNGDVPWSVAERVAYVRAHRDEFSLR